jgi:apyrase
MGSQQRLPSSSRGRVAGAITLLAASSLALLLLAPRSATPRYSFIIDAGNTGSCVHVIAYRVGPGWGAPPRLDWARTASLKAHTGLLSFAEDPAGAGLSLAPLVDFAWRRVPPESWADTELRLMAMAGLRLLDAAVAESVLESCRDVLRQYGTSRKPHIHDHFPVTIYVLVIEV